VGGLKTTIGSRDLRVIIMSLPLLHVSTMIYANGRWGVEKEVGPPKITHTGGAYASNVIRGTLR